MARRSAKVAPALPIAASPVALAAEDAALDVPVYAVTEHINGGIRRRYGETFTVPRDRVAEQEARGVVLAASAVRALWNDAPGRVLSPAGIPAPAPATPADHAVRVLHLCDYDPGSAAYRYHSAMNTDPGLVSAFVRWGDANPHSSLRQYDGDVDRRTVEALFLTADVIHVHIDYNGLYQHLRQLPDRARQVLVRHYHGSVSSSAPRVLVENDRDRELGAVQVGARLYHYQFSDAMQWLPIPVPCDAYAEVGACRREVTWGPLRVAHSPTVRAIKGTDVLERVVAELRAEGVPIELVLIEGVSHAEALELKGTCDVTFDSFWLGLQGSGLEGAAMGQAVVAGDPGVAQDYRARLGECPYTYADPETLRDVLYRLALDPEFRENEAQRVGDYARSLHNYAAVAARYRSIIAPALAARVSEV
jgi:hypothetical protein